MRRIVGVAIAVVGLLSLTIAGASANGVTGPAFYVDGKQYRTVGTPTDFSNTGAPIHSIDTIYAIPGVPNVADAKPGDRDYNGGRWMVVEVMIEPDLEEGETINDYLYEMYGDPDGITSDAELMFYAGAGVVTITDNVINQFECPVIPLPGGGNR